ncbi:hypothetical protein GDO81_013578 [Engystomops pustulosus]|uniref:Uncharacterized protein n=1 Tax=Engystomops pustulosus TaxID=76066 RepID=A0AAV7B4E3_ENGPU|nr:hypothetical protein GDO81_013578 [Engystomops pustulosus]
MMPYAVASGKRDLDGWPHCWLKLRPLASRQMLLPRHPVGFVVRVGNHGRLSACLHQRRRPCIVSLSPLPRQARGLVLLWPSLQSWLW